MPIAKSANGQAQQELRFRNRIIGLLFVLLLFLGVALWRLPTQFSVFVPPDLTRPQFVRPNEMPPSYVYAFAKLVMEAINYCPQDCARDYGQNLVKMRDYLTSSCIHDLAMHRERNSSLYEFRSRKLLPTDDSFYNEDRVLRLDHNVWQVRVEYLLEEHVKGVQTRNRRYQYPVRVVRYDVPVDRNPFQLAFDCYVAPGPRPAPES